MAVQLQALMKEVYGRDSARLLMTLLTDAKKPVGYSIARRRLDIHPQEFQRTVETLERMALMGRILEPTKDPNHYNVLLEPTRTGRHVVGLWDQLEKAAHQDKALATTLEFPKSLDESLHGSAGVA